MLLNWPLEMVDIPVIPATHSGVNLPPEGGAGLRMINLTLVAGLPSIRSRVLHGGNLL